MGTHFEPALYQEVVAGFVSEMHGVAIRFGIEQPLALIHLPAEVAHGIRQLTVLAHATQRLGYRLAFTCSCKGFYNGFRVRVKGLGELK